MAIASWDIYECDGNRKIIIKNKTDVVTGTIMCSVCQNAAVYRYSVKELKDIA